MPIFSFMTELISRLKMKVHCIVFVLLWHSVSFNRDSTKNLQHTSTHQDSSSKTEPGISSSQISLQLSLFPVYETAASFKL